MYASAYKWNLGEISGQPNTCVCMPMNNPGDGVSCM